MKKLIASAFMAVLMTTGVVAQGGPAANAVTSASYGPARPNPKPIIDRVNHLIKIHKMSHARGTKYIQKLREYKAVGAISQARFDRLKKRIRTAEKHYRR
ncbi:hypothetical protein GCM10009798_01470 [Nocardioides panacihumi]|uniref:SHOCT domain-containing protein n=1 Tax=Nocardioides panacihumi TaxID=400774 RepID=A0ABP5BIV5_9ACTN